MRQYLLGDMPQEDRARIEDRYFADADMFEEMVAAENDLIDSYIRGELKDPDRQKFELRYGKSPRQRARVEFARALNQVSQTTAQALHVNRVSLWKRLWVPFLGQAPTLQRALAVTALVVVASGSWLVVQNQRLRAELQQARAGQAELRRQEEALHQQLLALSKNSGDHARENNQGVEIAQLETPVQSEVTLRLVPGLARGSGRGEQELVLLPRVAWVRLELTLYRDEYRSYQAVLRTAEGAEVRRLEGLKGQRIGDEKAVILSLPSNLIRLGDYVVTLSGRNDSRGAREEVEAYSFRVVRP